MTTRRALVTAVAALVLVPLAVVSARRSRDERALAQFDRVVRQNALALLEEGREIFRFDTMGDEAFWGDTLRLHESIEGEALGGVGDGLTPRKALELGLKVDLDALPRSLRGQLRRGEVDLDDPATTIALLGLDAVVGVTGFLEGEGLRAVGIQCALCHSTVDDAFAPGIGNRLDGWANRDLDIGQIISLAANLQPLADLLSVDVPFVQSVLRSWGPGKFDAQLLLDGQAFAPGDKPAATLIPPAFGLAGVNLHTWTGAWGTVSYWNAFVANLEMGGQGTFYDPRLNDPARFPIAVKAGSANVRHTPDLVTSKLPALHFYQLAIPAPEPPSGSFDPTAAAQGKDIFEGKAGCATCHVPPLFTEPGWNLHLPSEIGIDDFQANRSPDRRYRTSPLAGLWTHQKGGFYHDGRFATLLDVVEHYNGFLKLGLGEGEKHALVEYLKSL
jgi:mono/diheme cytochrome c family protein